MAAFPGASLADGPANYYGAKPGPRDLAMQSVYEERAADWRNGAVVYQIIVDRFAPPADLDAKRSLYPAPKRLRDWSEEPRKGTYVDEAGVWSHEIDFWGGDLQSARSKLSHIAKLGADVLYLNPIHDAYTNHKYDARDYFAISPEYGGRDDFRALAADAENMGLKLVVDGVFNHMGKNSPWFREAMADPASHWREWYYVGSQYERGYRAWVNVENLPEVRLDNPNVRARLWGDPDSVVQGYLNDGADGWRLDVAFDIGPAYLHELTEAAHAAKPGSLVVGEIWNYPAEWFPSVDGVMNFHVRELTHQLSDGRLSGERFGRMFERLVQDCGIEHLLKSWLVLDNHDTQRLANMIPDAAARRAALALQFALPGSPCVYYGTELGMAGGDDPENRAPMRWDLATDDNEDLAYMRKLIGLRNGNRALRVGDFLLLDSDQLLAFARKTDRVAETVFVVANFTDEPIAETLQARDGKIMSYAWARDALSDYSAQVFAGAMRVEVPAKTVRLLQPVIDHTIEYSPYKRVQ